MTHSQPASKNKHDDLTPNRAKSKANPTQVKPIQEQVEQKDKALGEHEAHTSPPSILIPEYAYAFRLTKDKTLVREWVTDSFVQITGFTPEELEAQGGWQALIHPEDMPIALARSARLLAGQPDISEFRIVRKDGEIRWLRDHGYPLVNRAGEVTHIFGAAQDITEYKRFEKDLERAKRFLQAILDTIPMHIAILDEEGIIIAVNLAWRAFARANNLNMPNDGIGASYIAVCEKAAKEGEAQAARAAEIIRKILSGASTQAFFEYPCHSPDKQRWFYVHFSSFVENDHLRVAVTHYDITERKRHEQEIQAQALLVQALSKKQSLEALLVDILQAAQSAFPFAEKGSILLADPDGFLTIRAIVGYQDSRLLGQRFDPWRGYAARAFRENRPILIADVQASVEDFLPNQSEEVSSIKSAIAAPLTVEGYPLGVICLDNATRTAAFEDRDIHILTTFAATAALVIERARLLEESQRRLEELSVLHQASQALLSSRLEPFALYQSVHHAIAQLMPCEAFFIVLDDEAGGDYHAVYLYDIGGVHPPQRVPRGKGLSGYVLSTGQPVRMDDYLAQDQIEALSFGDPEEVRAILAVPLRIGEETIGVISVQAYQPNAYDEEDQRLLETLAALFATLIRNAYLLEKSQRHLRELEILQRLSTALRKTQTLDEMCPLFVSHALQAVGADIGSIYLLEPHTGEWVSRLWFNAQGDLISPQGLELRHRPSEGVTGYVGMKGEIYQSSNWRSDGISVIKPEEERLIHPYSSCISLPLRAEQQVIGVMHLWGATPRTYTEEECHLLLAIADMAGSALRRAQLHQETLHRLEQLRSLNSIGRTISSTLDVRFSLDLLLKQTCIQLGVDAAGVLIYNPISLCLEYASGYGFRSDLYQTSRVRLGTGLAGLAGRERRPILISDLDHSPFPFARQELRREEHFVSYAAFPLLTKGELKGILEVFHRTQLAFSPDWLEFIESLSLQAAIAIENAQLFEGLQRTNLELSLAYDATLESWVRSLDARLREPDDHTARVTELTVRLAQAMNVNEANLPHIRRGALLHDIGKMFIPESILQKVEPLTPEEIAIVRQHPQYAYDLLSHITLLKPALEIPYYHHERWDGSGYPQGLKGEDIPLAARIFAVVDVFDAITTARPYRAAWSKLEALSYLREQAGRLFDPRVVEAFLHLIS